MEDDLSAGIFPRYGPLTIILVYVLDVEIEADPLSHCLAGIEVPVDVIIEIVRSVLCLEDTIEDVLFWRLGHWRV